jgi:hypothetical protein
MKAFDGAAMMAHLSVPFVCDAGNLNFLSTHRGHNLQVLVVLKIQVFRFADVSAFFMLTLCFVSNKQLSLS